MGVIFRRARRVEERRWRGRRAARARRPAGGAKAASDPICVGVRMSLSREELLAAYAAGATSPGLSLLCAAHLTLSAEGRSYVSALEEIGGALLKSEDPTPVAANCGGMSFDALLARIDLEDATPPPAPKQEPVEAGPLPLPVARALGMKFSEVPWKTRLRRISEHVLFEIDGEKASLMRARPGARVPDHDHRGDEATLVLSGAMRDGERVMTSGDISLCGPDHAHHPEIVGDDVCYCLIVVDGKLRFNGPFGRALNLFAE